MVAAMPKRPSELINGGDVGQVSQQPQLQQSQRSSGWAGLLVAILAGWLIFTVVSRMDWNGGDRKQDDHHEQKDDDGKKQDGKKVVAKPAYLVIVTERIDTVDTSLAIDRIAKFCIDQKAAGVDLEYRNPDKDDDSEPVKKLIAHAAAKNIPPPFVLFKNKDKELLGVIKLPPADATDAQIMEVFKQ